MDETPLDTIDRAILFHLQQDGRRTITDIADAIDVSDNTVRNRIQAMEEAGVISGYRVNVNYDRAGSITTICSSVPPASVAASNSPPKPGTSPASSR